MIRAVEARPKMEHVTPPLNAPPKAGPIRAHVPKDSESAVHVSSTLKGRVFKPVVFKPNVFYMSLLFKIATNLVLKLQLYSLLCTVRKNVSLLLIEL